MKKQISYDYSNLSNAAIRDILTNHWNKIDLLKKGGKIMLKDLSQSLMDFHVRNGGEERTSRTAISKILRELSIKLPSNFKSTLERGKWEINLGGKSTKPKPIKASKIKPIKKSYPTINPDVAFGNGNYSVYVFYYGKDSCKIGKSNNVENRYHTYKTAFSQAWTFKFQILHDSEIKMKAYEKSLQYILKYKGHHIDTQDGLSGQEHFNISPTKLKNMIISLNRFLGIR